MEVTTIWTTSHQLIHRLYPRRILCCFHILDHQYINQLPYFWAHRQWNQILLRQHQLQNNAFKGKKALLMIGSDPTCLSLFDKQPISVPKLGRTSKRTHWCRRKRGKRKAQKQKGWARTEEPTKISSLLKYYTNKYGGCGFCCLFA